MIGIVEIVVELLDDDIVYHGFFVQCLQQDQDDVAGHALDWRDVLEQVLLSGKVEIGDARLASPDFVEFIAWKGTVADRVAKAVERVNSADTDSRPFAYWLCLRGNADRFEGDK